MKTMRSWNDLKPYGIHFLTGEADGLGLRLLCELDPNGHKIMSEYFGNTLTRNAEAEIGGMLGALSFIIDKIEMRSGNDYHLQYLRRRVHKMAERVGPVDVTGHFESDGWRILTNGRIGTTVNGPNQYSETDDQREGLWASVMLSRDELQPLAAFCLLHDHDVAVITSYESAYDGVVMGFSWEEWDERQDMINTGTNGIYQMYTKSRQPGNGFRNTHAFTGITEH